MIYLMTLSK